MLEVIATSVSDVLIISDSRANRIELCVDIDLDGLTPSIELINKCLFITKKPIRVMLRNRNDFILTDEDILEFCNLINNIQSDMLDGYVLGFLKDQKCDMRAKKIIDVINNKKVTFHRASDLIVDDITQICNLNIDTVLTSGGINGLNYDVLMEMRKKLRGIELLIGGGVNEKNIYDVIKVSRSVHIGSSVRKNKSFSCEIDVNKINYFSDIINS